MFTKFDIIVSIVTSLLCGIAIGRVDSKVQQFDRECDLVLKRKIEADNPKE